jgi:exopolysaccharide production protein ExoZ
MLLSALGGTQAVVRNPAPWVKKCFRCAHPGRRVEVVKQKVNNIQALRAYAALAVVIFHTGFTFPHMLQMGKFGVDIFFVISGYIMARICDTDSRWFLRRRLIRILPPYWVLTFLLFVFSLWFPSLLLSTHPGFTELLKSLFFVPYYRADGLIRPLLFVGWSLNYEMLFYLLVALGIYLVPRHPLVFVSGSLIALQSVCRLFAGFGAVPMCYSDKVIFEFVFGILAYAIASRIASSTAVQIRVFSLLALIISLAGMSFLQGVAHSPFPAEWLAMQVLAMLVVLSASLLSQGGWDIRIRWIVIVGDASYVLYLVHAYILNLSDRVLNWRLPWIQMTHASGCLILSAVCVAVAVLLHLKLEKPFVNYLNGRFGGHRRSTEFRFPFAPERDAA